MDWDRALLTVCTFKFVDYVNFDGFDNRYYISWRCYELLLLILFLKDQNTTLGTRGKEEGARGKARKV